MAATGSYLNTPCSFLERGHGSRQLVSLCVTLEFTHPFVLDAAVAILVKIVCYDTDVTTLSSPSPSPSPSLSLLSADTNIEGYRASGVTTRHSPSPLNHSYFYFYILWPRP
jgi:hypothetical protein